MGTGRPANHRWGYRDAGGTWVDGTTPPAGAVSGYYDEARRAWVGGVPAGWVPGYRMGYRDAGTGQWVESAAVPAGSVIGWWDETRGVWIQGIPEETGDSAAQPIAGTKDSRVAAELGAGGKSGWWPWLLAALVAAGLLYGLITWREFRMAVIVATPAAVATAAAETPAAESDAAEPAQAAAVTVTVTATAEPSPVATGAAGPVASPAAETTEPANAGETGAARTEPAGAASTLALPCQPKVSSPDGFIAGLKEAGLPIGDAVIYTGANDPDCLLGEDGGYDAAFGFADASLPRADGVAGGGVIEFFRDADRARARAERAEAAAGSEVREVFGPILVRLSAKMDGKQIGAYGDAIAGLTGCAPDR